RAGAARDRRKKKAPGGPAKQTAAKRPERRAMIAAPRSRVMAFSRRVDRAANRGLERSYPPLRRAWRTALPFALAVAAFAWRGLRPLLRLLFLALAAAESL